VSYLAVPVFGRAGEVLGGLFFGHQKPGVFTLRDEKIIVAVAAQAAAAMNAARLYEAEQKARAAAERANQAKDHFIATLSHELRTPLTPVLTILSSLRDDPTLSPTVAADLETARRNVLLEARLIDDLLDLTRISRGKLSLQEEVLFVEGLIETAVNTCRPDLEPRELELIRELRAPSATIFGDSARITQVLWNLLKNAIKFTPDGGTITIRSRVQRGENANEVVIEVQDTGVGIEADVLPRIFSAFEQGGRETTRRFGGLGLGLAISKAIVEAHRGKLAVTSPGRNQGSTFTLTLPLASRESSATPASRMDPARKTDAMKQNAAPPARALRILLVEDHADSAKTLKRLLNSWGHSVAVAGTVAEALQTAETEMNGAGLDLVISDLGLPDASGLELMRALSSKYSLLGIALSGFGMESDLEQSTAAGFARHLTKPVDINLIRAAIQEIATKKNSS
jgi:signal transduction histidine kinase/ActR/RegA family two-component response regulator